MRLAVIPARGGSKRIPRKNIRPFHGKPIIAWSIEAARQSGAFDRILVSTDDAEIAAVAGQCGAQAPFTRPPELSGDHAATTEVIAHAVQWARGQGWAPGAVCCLYATAPFTRGEDIRRGMEALESGKWEYAFSATDFAAPVFRSFRRNPDGSVEMFFPEHFPTRSQDLPAAWHDAAQFYWGKPAAWLEGKPLFAPHSFAVTIPRWRVQDIDTEEDWARAELLAPSILGKAP